MKLKRNSRSPVVVHCNICGSHSHSCLLNLFFSFVHPCIHTHTYTRRMLTHARLVARARARTLTQHDSRFNYTSSLSHAPNIACDCPASCWAFFFFFFSFLAVLSILTALCVGSVLLSRHLCLWLRVSVCVCVCDSYFFVYLIFVSARTIISRANCDNKRRPTQSLGNASLPTKKKTKKKCPQR